tara:strand:- start:24 stop:227 length:204 start_codon:yes stop_codon:yes gene_type:complete
LQHSSLVHSVPEQFPEALYSDNVPEQLDLVKFDTHVDEADGLDVPDLQHSSAVQGVSRHSLEPLLLS